jgi:hypothetical protein
VGISFCKRAEVGGSKGSLYSYPPQQGEQQLCGKASNAKERQTYDEKRKRTRQV